MRNIIKSLLIICLGFPFAASGQQTAKGFITISNVSDIARNDAVVAIAWNDVRKKYPLIDTSGFKVVLAGSKKELPFQLEYSGEPDVQNLLLQLSVGAKSSVKVEIMKGKPAAFTPKTYARYVPERKDDFTWENDKIAFRMYGQALEGTRENAYGIDVWVKRTDKLIINERYKRGEYHVDHGDGMDYYHVGLSLGAGNMAPYVMDTIRYSKNYTSWKVLDNGPLRSTFQLGYDAWDVAGTAVKATKTVSLDAGSRLSRVEVTYSYAGTAPMPVTVGIIKRKEPGSIILDEQSGITAYWEPQHGSDGITGVGSILPGPIRAKVTDEQLLAITRVKSDEPIIYYTGAAWNKAGEITDASAWFGYLHSFKKMLQHPLKVEIQ